MNTAQEARIYKDNNKLINQIIEYYWSLVHSDNLEENQAARPIGKALDDQSITGLIKALREIKNNHPVHTWSVVFAAKHLMRALKKARDTYCDNSEEEDLTEAGC